MTERTHAERRRIFTRYFRRLVSRKGLLLKDIQVVTGLASSAVSDYHNGRKFPSLKNAAKLAEAMTEPRLLDLVRMLRTKTCQNVSCGDEYIDRTNQFISKYCSKRCNTNTYNRSVNQRRTDERKLAFTELGRKRKAIAAFCEQCPWMELPGYCPLPDDCALAPESPLPALRTPAMGRAAPRASDKMLRYIDTRFRPELAKEAG